MKRGSALLALALALTGGLGSASVCAQSIVIGMSAPLTGPQSRFGLELERGLRAGLEEANAAGGVGGKRVELIARDDAGQPERVAANTRALIEAGALALTGYHGVAWHKAVWPLLEKSGVPLVGVASSAELLREPARRTVFNLRAGARDEAAAMIYQLDTVSQTEIAVVHQYDPIGESILDGVQQELIRVGLRPQASVRLPAAASTAAVAAAVQSACKESPRVLLLALDAPNALAVIREARRARCMAQFYMTSEAGDQLVTGSLAPGEMAGVVVAQVVPNPLSQSLPLLVDYRKQLGGAQAS